MIWREAYTADPIGMSLILYGIFAFCQCIPQLDSLVTRTRHNLSIVYREGDTQDILITEINSFALIILL